MSAKLDDAGWLSGARCVVSPNCDARPDGTAIELVVVHNISLPPGEFGGDGVERLFTNSLDPGEHPFYATLRDLRVSTHFFVRRSGQLVQFVPCALRAWHAGPSRFDGRERCNDFSIGIELEGTDTRPFTSKQYARLARLLTLLRSRYPITDVAGHSDVAPGRKTDPGPAFEWRRLRALVGTRFRMPRR